MTKNTQLCVLLALGVAFLAYVVFKVHEAGYMPPTFGGPI